MFKPVKVCIVGCGRVSKSHLAGMNEIPEELQVVAIVSSNLEKRKSLSKQYSIPKTFSSLEEALKDPEIEAVDLCLPNDVHKDATIQSVRAGKHVFVEKPMANTTADCLEMIHCADEAGVHLMVGQSRRFHDAVFKFQGAVRPK